jgi:uncharacterized protein (DUF433 family)
MVNSNRARRIYGAMDPREAPRYSIGEAAQFLWVREKTLRRWATGEAGRRAVIRVADPRARLLSFLNLVELHVLSFLRDQQVPLQRIRRAVEYLERHLGDTAHPLLAMDVLTDGANVFVDQLEGARGTLVNVSREGQIAMRALLEAHLRRIDRNTRTRAVLRLYPFAWRVRSVVDATDQPKPIAIDPLIAFGRPVLVGTRVPTVEIASRVGAGESMQAVAEDMQLDLAKVEDALRYHIAAA